MPVRAHRHSFGGMPVQHSVADAGTVAEVVNLVVLLDFEACPLAKLQRHEVQTVSS